MPYQGLFEEACLEPLVRLLICVARLQYLCDQRYTLAILA